MDLNRNKIIKILFTSVGRRVELIQAFRKAADSARTKLFIYGADLSASAPAMFFCDKKVITPAIKDDNYIPFLEEFCKNEQITAIIPTIDTDLLILAHNKEKFESSGTRVVVSAPDKVAVCRDKRITYDFFTECGLKSPEPVTRVEDYSAGFPCFIKPKDGSSSINAHKAENKEELITYASETPDYIIQPYIKGKEYTVDIFCDFKGSPIYITPRERIAVRSGEVLKTKILSDEKITSECLKIIENFKPSGAVTVQLIRSDTDGEDYFIEINPRYGGGAPLSIKAGADSPSALIGLLAGGEFGYIENAARGGLVYSRFDQSVCVNEYPYKRTKAVIFDLDDTLYSEKEYVLCGFKAAALELKEIDNAYEELAAFFEKGMPAIDSLFKKFGLSDTNLKEKCLSAYRKCKPSLTLYPGAERLLRHLKQRGIKTAILTDGRPEGQRAKIEALGLEKYFDEILITDELGGPIFRKPDTIGFEILQRKLGAAFDEMLYVGDNPAKDFIAPLKLGMRAVYFENPRGLYYSSSLCLADGIEKITSLRDINGLLVV